MSYRVLKLSTILIPTILIGGFEFLRHTVLMLHQFSMMEGNYIITLLTFLVSYVFSNWLFKTIEEKNKRITAEREMRVIYEERERLAKELHDNIAQTLFLLKVHLKKGKLQDAQGLVNSIDSNLRQAIFNLRMNPSEKTSFSKRIDSWLEDWSTVSGIEVKHSIDFPEGYFTPAEEVQLFSIMQEAFANVRKHSEADSVSFTLNTLQKRWELKIKDNGKGFSVIDIPINKYGLAMLKERALKINGRMEISSAEGMGTELIMKGEKD
ncbi:sensor histidine kinase [Bacillus sp. BRMEA1]|uniref:sensor histidine kinase n=1 Tax=Neobacillus endophyticus TaxID=2738405 RepID=UPI001564942F|nr:ATP-binding protein [Neobacillus endophyticus]NRD78068.1 sensor histidine kinase [Neobacillus endophyticus]